MAEIDKLTPTNILLVLQFLAPGALIVYFRSLFVTRRLAGFKDNISLFIVLSIIYAFVLLPVVWLTGGTISAGPWWAWLVWLLALVVIPAGFGTFLGVSVQRGWLGDALARCGLEPVSPYPTAWDWAFSQMPCTYVIVTLDDGSKVAGWFGEKSLAASNLEHKDMFIEELYDLDKLGNWSKRLNRQAIFISGKSIRYVEFVFG